MDLTIILVIVAIVFLWLLVFSVWKNGKNGRKPYSSANGEYNPTAILTPNEIDFLAKLQLALPEVGGYIFPQVSFSAFLTPKVGQNNRLWVKFFRAISQKRCDFLIVDKMFNPLFVIECDDASHNGKEKRDGERDRLVETAGIQTVRIYNNRDLSPEIMRKAILHNSDVANKIIRANYNNQEIEI